MQIIAAFRAARRPRRSGAGPNRGAMSHRGDSAPIRDRGSIIATSSL
jgi:hypothetical protein